MARIFIDGFESAPDAGTQLWEGWSGNNESLPDAAAGGFTGSYYMHFPESAGAAKYIPECSSIYIGVLQAPRPSTIIRFFGGSSHAVLQGWVSITIGADQIGVHNNQTGGGFDHVYNYTAGSKDHIQVYFENIDDTDKNVKVKLNDVEIIDYNLTNPVADKDKTTAISISAGSGVGEYHAYVDDVVIDDAEWPGISEIYGMSPSANGTTTDWVASSGENYQAVDEVPATEVDWVSSATPAAVDIYESDTPLQGDEDVKSVQAQYYVEGNSYFQPCISSGETTHYGPQISGESLIVPHCTSQIWENNPISSGEWSVLDIDRMKTGMRLV